MAPSLQPYIDFVGSKVLPVWYALAGVAVGVALGMIHAVRDIVPEQIPKTLNNLIKSFQSTAEDLKKGAAQSMEKMQDVAVQRANIVKKHLDDFTNGGVKRIYANANASANGHAVAAG